MANAFPGTQYSLTSSSPCSGAPMTLAAWTRRTSEVITPRVASYVGETPTATRSGNVINHRQDTVVRCASFSTNNTVAQAGMSIPSPINTWVHIVGTFSAANSRSVYQDGVFGSSNTNAVTYSAANTVCLGASTSTTGWANFFFGDLAEIGVWDAVLTDAEIASLAKGFSCRRVRPQNLRFYAPLVRSQTDIRGGLVLTPITNGAPPTPGTVTPSNHVRIYA